MEMSDETATAGAGEKISHDDFPPFFFFWFFVPGPFVTRKMVRRDISAVHQLWISLLQPQSELPHASAATLSAPLLLLMRLLCYGD